MGIQTEFHGGDAVHPKLERKGESTEQVYVVGKGSKYHSRWCRFVQKPPASSRIFMMSKRQAMEDGLAPCKACTESELSSG